MIRETIKSGLPQPTEYLVFNTRRPVFADIRVRRALTLLFDFEWINQNYFFGLYTRSGGYFPGSELSAYARPADERERELLSRLRRDIAPDILDGSYRLPVADGSGVTSSATAVPRATTTARSALIRQRSSKDHAASSLHSKQAGADERRGLVDPVAAHEERDRVGGAEQHDRPGHDVVHAAEQREEQQHARRCRRSRQSAARDVASRVHAYASTPAYTPPTASARIYTRTGRA